MTKESSQERLKRGSLYVVPHLGIFVLLLLGIGWAGHVYYAKQRDRFIKATYEQLSAIADLKLSQISVWLDDQTRDIQVFIENPVLVRALRSVLRSPNSSPERSGVLQCMKSLVANYGYLHLALLNPAGDILLQAGEPSLSVVSPEGLTFVRELETESRATCSDLLRDPASGEIFMNVLGPIPAQSNETSGAAGFLLVRVNPALHLFTMIQSWPTPSPTSEALLVRQEGSEIVFLNELRHRKNTALNLRFPLSSGDLPAVKAVRGETGLLEGVDYRGVPVLAVGRKVPGSSWFLVAKVDRDEIFAPLRRQVFRLLLVCLGLALAAGGGIVYVYHRQQLSNLRRLHATTVKRLEQFALLRQVLENSNARIFSVDAGFRYTTFNSEHAAAMKSSHGVDIEIGKNILDYMTVPEERDRALQNLSRSLRGEIINAEDFSGEKGLSRRYYQISHNPIHTVDGRIIGVVVVANDITERRQNEDKMRALNLELEGRVADRTAQLEYANRELESFSYSVSHDLRAPLRRIDGFSQMLLDDYSGALDDQGKNFLRRIRVGTQRMEKLIDDLLTLSRLSLSDMDRRSVDISGMARAVIASLSQADPDRRVDVAIQDGLAAEADPNLTRIILENLLGNAWKFTAGTAKARVEFGMTEADGARIFRIGDNGVGFDMAYAGKLFAPFQRLHSQGEFPGTGIGLATVQRIIHRHGGRIWAEASPGKGATFFFTLG